MEDLNTEKLEKKFLSYDLKIDNIDDFKTILDKVKKDIEQVESSLTQLSNFELKISLAK